MTAPGAGAPRWSSSDFAGMRRPARPDWVPTAEEDNGRFRSVMDRERSKRHWWNNDTEGLKADVEQNGRMTSLEFFALRYDLAQLEAPADDGPECFPEPYELLYGDESVSWSDASRSVITKPEALRALAKEVRRLDAWVKLANLPELVAKLFEFDEAAAIKLQACSDPGCGFVAVCPTGDHAQYFNKRCWLRICPNCARHIAARLRERYTRRIKALLANPVRGWSLKFLTISLKRSDDARRDLEDVHDLTRGMVKHFFLKAGKRAGAVAFPEWGPKGGNIHSHSMPYGPFANQALMSDWLRLRSVKLRPIWRPWFDGERARILRRAGELKIVSRQLGRSRSDHARRVRWARDQYRRMADQLRKGARQTSDVDAYLLKMAKRAGVGDRIVDIRMVHDVDSAVAEVVKYVSKLHKKDERGAYIADAADRVAMHMAMKGKRRAWAWGSMYDPEDEPEEEAAAEDDPWESVHTCPKCGTPLMMVGGEEWGALRARLQSKPAIKSRMLGVAAVQLNLPGAPPG